MRAIFLKRCGYDRHAGQRHWRDGEPQIDPSSRQVGDGNLTAHIPKELVVKSSVALEVFGG